VPENLNPSRVAAAGVLLGDVDADGDTLTASLLAGASHGTVTLDADGSFIYTPDAQFNGTDSFTYTVSDGLRDSNEATVTITVTEKNDPPAAGDDAYSVPSGSVLAINAASGVLDNDSDPDGNALTAVAATDPANGALTFHADGSFTYTPDAAFHGIDSFTYRATDGLLESTDATVTILVNSPAATVDDVYDVAEEATLTVVAVDGVLANDVDPDGNDLTVSLVSGPSHGTASLAADGSFTYTPETDFNGTDVFTYRADDGFEESGETTVTITVTAVDDVPIAFSQSRSTGEDVFAEITLVGDDGDPELTQALIYALASTPLHGTLSGFDPNTGAVTYTPDLHYHGQDSFDFTVGDGNSTSTEATVALTVTAVNDPPAAVDDTATTEEDVPVVIDVLANDSDDDVGDVLVIDSVTQGALGAVVIHANGTLTYTPEIGLDGSDQFTYTISDGNGGTDTATVDVTITPAPDVPLIVAGHHTLLPNQAGQEIEVLISGGHAVEGMNFYIQVGDGGPEAVDLGLIDPPGIDGPHVENVDLETGTIFESNNSGQFNPDTNETLPQLFGAFIVTNAATTTADGLLATVTIDTTGFTAGTWELRVSDTLAGDTELPFVGARFHNGSITIDPDPALTDPTFAALEDVTLLAGSPLIVPLDGFDPDGEDLTYTVSVSQGSPVTASIPEGNRSLRISVADYGQMVAELHDNLVPAVTDQIVAYAEDDLYDGSDFHRVINGFMIQGGITSVTTEFDDVFHVDLQHNRGGVLSMAKADDDTNTSQFFITEVPTRWLDFNHSIFGQLVEGDAVREAIASVATGGGDAPLVDVVMESVDVFIDKENGLLMLKAPEGSTGETDVTVTVTDESLNTYQQTFHVTLAVDTEDGGPFLEPIAMQQTLMDTTLQFQLSAIDVENDAVLFESFVPTGAQYTLDVNAQTGLATFTPPSGFVGEIEIQVRVTPVGASSFFDSQTVKIVVADPSVALSDAVLASEGSWI